MCEYLLQMKMEMLNKHCICDGDKEDADDKDYVEDHLGEDSKNSKPIILDVMLDQIRHSNIYNHFLLNAI